jgi:hypothetical protein
MSQPSRPQIRNLELIRSQNAKHGEAFDDVRIHLGNLQDQLSQALAQIAALQKKVG